MILNYNITYPSDPCHAICIYCFLMFSCRLMLTCGEWIDGTVAVRFCLTTMAVINIFYIILFFIYNHIYILLVSYSYLCCYRQLV